MHGDLPPSLFIAVDRFNGRSQKIRQLSLGLLETTPEAREFHLFHNFCLLPKVLISNLFLFLYDIVVQMSTPFA